MLITSMLSGCLAPQKTPVASWRIAAELPALPGGKAANGYAGSVIGINQNILFVGGGANFPGAMPWLGGKKKYYNDLFAFRISNGNLALIQPNFELPEAVAYSANCSTSKGIVFAGGENDAGISANVYLLTWNNNLRKPDFTRLPSLPQPLTNASVCADGEVIYVAGGENAATASDRFYYLDMSRQAGGWDSLPDIPHAVSHAVLIVQQMENKKYIFLCGGRKKNTGGISDLYSQVYAYDIKNKKWEERAALPYALSAGTGIAYKKNILLLGGDKGTTFHEAETLIAAIAKETDLNKKEILNEQKKIVQAGHPGFSNEMLLYDMEKNKWSAAGKIPFPVPATTTAVSTGSELFIPSGEIKAGVRTPGILEGNLKD